MVNHIGLGHFFKTASIDMMLKTAAMPSCAQQTAPTAWLAVQHFLSVAGASGAIGSFDTASQLKSRFAGAPVVEVHTTIHARRIQRVQFLLSDAVEPP